MSVVKDVDLEAMPSSIFVIDDDDDEVSRVRAPVLRRSTGNTYIVIVHWEIYFFLTFSLYYARTCTSMM